jgi:hypothetical protein
MSTYIKRTERTQINNLIPHLKILEKQEQEKYKSSRRREVIKIRAEINEIETKTTTKNPPKKPPKTIQSKESMKQKTDSLKK